MKDQLLSLSDKIKTLEDKVKSEEATKQAMVLPLLQILGYDVFNPEEVMPEVICDFSGKGDKVDYVISLNGKHEIIIECKECHQNLNNHVSQLRKYFAASEARFAILTNGLHYLFFSDHNKANIMDEKPFYSLDMFNLSDSDIEFLYSFQKNVFIPYQMITKSKDIVYSKAILSELQREFSKPSKELVKLLISDIYYGKLNESTYNKFSKIIKNCLKFLLKEEFVKIDIEKGQNINEEPSYIFTEEEKKLNDTIKEWLVKYETNELHIKFRKLANGYVGVDFENRWWPICRFKIRPKFDDKICVKICNEASASKSSEIYIKEISEIEMAKEAVEIQCADTRNRLLKYRLDHNY